MNAPFNLSHPVLQADGLAVGYAPPRKTPRIVLNEVQIALRGGELVCLIGPNGAGKSTLMRTLAGMQSPLAGRVRLMDADVTTLTPAERARHLAVVLTERLDVGILSAYELVALGRYPYTDWLGGLTETDHAAIQRALAAVGAVELAGRDVNELSDGERQKVLIARALAQEPALLLLDEPTAFLDLPRRAEVMTMLRGLTRTTGCAILLSTHDLDLALRTADRIWLLPAGGPLHQGAPEDLVLSGAFEAAFRAEGIQFDAYTGAFRGSVQPAGIVAVEGDGLPALWTTRALEREGFCVVNAGQSVPLTVRVTDSGGAPHWQVRRGDFQRECDSLYALTQTLRELPTI